MPCPYCVSCEPFASCHLRHSEERATTLGRPYRTLFVVSPSAALRTGLSYHERSFDRLRANVERTTLVDKRVWPCQNYNA